MVSRSAASASSAAASWVRASQRSARAGQDVVVVESSDDAVRSTVERLERSLDRAAAKGKIQSVDAVMQHVDVVTALSALADRELVVEAIVEDERAKVELFRRLDEIVTDRRAILRRTLHRSRS